MIFGTSPVYNAILFYIFLIIILLVVKPDIMYNNKTKKFKSFGCGKDQTFFAFPLVVLASVILFYFFFLFGDILNNYLESQ
ncbi:hypothetical protein Indivirus_1_49 [Indivirus ILV1]|uniref:Uncharacterized protein n=1 Tax=Indivirus ILV1 TaxID=1977633 RepID=A0A1V0SCI7_9VIRU|nr:hypothetical protein Indivirus_1_49 [Indivirus ILV1]